MNEMATSQYDYDSFMPIKADSDDFKQYKYTNVHHFDMPMVKTQLQRPSQQHSKPRIPSQKSQTFAEYSSKALLKASSINSR